MMWRQEKWQASRGVVCIYLPIGPIDIYQPPVLIIKMRAWICSCAPVVGNVVVPYLLDWRDVYCREKLLLPSLLRVMGIENNFSLN